MGMEEIVRLILDLGGNARDTQELVDKLHALKGAADRVADSYQTLAVSGKGYEVVQDQTNREMDEAVRKAMELTQSQKLMAQMLNENQVHIASAGSHIDTHLIGGKGGAGGAGGRGLLGASYALQDFTSQLTDGGFARALSSVQNNIPQMLMGTGISTAAIAGISAAAVGIGLLVTNFKSLSEALGGSKTETETERMKKLGDATHLAAGEQKLYNAYKKEQTEGESLMEAKTEKQGKEAAQFKEFYAGQAPQIAAGIAETMTAEKTGAQPTEQEAHYQAILEHEVKMFTPGAARDASRAKLVDLRAKIRARTSEENAAKAARMMARSETDEATRGEISGMAARRPGAFPPGFGADFESMRNTEAAEQAEKDDARGLQERHDAIQRRGENQRIAKDMAAKIAAAENADQAHVRTVDAKAETDQKAAMVKQRKLEKLIAARSKGRTLQRQVFNQTGQRISLPDAMKLADQQESERQQNALDNLGLTEAAQRRNAAEAKQNQIRKGPEGIRQMGNQSGIQGTEAEVKNVAAGQAAELRRIQAQSLGTIIHESVETKRQIAMWQHFQQEFQNRTQLTNGIF